MSEPVKCWIDKQGRAWPEGYINDPMDVLDAIAVPLDMLAGFVEDSNYFHQAGGCVHTARAERELLRTMIREMRQEAPDE
jgi:hypothetical protein